MAILYKANETDFNHLGLGPLDDAVSILVIEERNGMFELEMSYPIEGTRINEIKLDRLIKADAGHNLKGQRFKIIRITKPIDGIVTINAEHVSYLTQDLSLKPTVNYSGTASQALNTWNNNLVDDSPFIVTSDIATTGSGSWSIKDVNNAREALGGVSGSILETYGGEYRFDNYSIRLMAQRGVNSGALIAYGRNLVDLTQEESIADTFTSIYPYAIYQDDSNKEVLLTLPEYFVDSEYVGNYARRKILPVDFSEDEIKDVATLRSRTNSYIKSNGIGIPKVNMQIKYIDLAKTLDYRDLAVLEEVNLCDNVFVYFEQLDVNTSAKIIKTVWDDLLEQYDSIEVGEAKSSLSNSINSTVDGKLETIVKRVNTIQLTADGLNVIYRGSEEPNPGNIGDLWYEPDGIYENMYQWDGSIWKLMLSTRDLDSVSEEVKKHTDEIATVTQSANDAVTKADQAIIDAGFAKIDSSTAIANALEATGLANIAKTNAATAITDSSTAIINAQTALNAYGNLKIGGSNLIGNFNFSFGKYIATDSGLIMNGDAINGVSEKILVSTNKFITLNLYDTITNYPYGAYSKIAFYREDGTFISQTPNVSWSVPTSATYPIPESTDHIRISLIGFDIYKYKLEFGNQGTAWTPAPEDVQVQITDINGELSRKASQTSFDTLDGTVSIQSTLISQSQTAIGLKADSTTVNTLTGTVNTQGTSITANATAIGLKAESSVVNTLSGKVTTNTTNITANATAINLRLTSAQVDSLVVAKNYVNTTQLSTTANGLQLDITKVSTDLSNLEIGGRNLFKNNSALERGTNRFLSFNTFDILADLVGEEVTVSFDIKITTTGISRSLNVYPYQDSGIVPSGRMSVIPTATWKRYSYTSKVVSNAVPTGYSQGEIAFYDPVGTNSYIIKNFQIEKGNKNTDYNMAPEEMATLEKFTTLNATVDGIQTTVATKASQTQVTQLATQITTKVESSTYNSKMTQLDSSINLRVQTSELLSQINIQAGKTLIQTGKLYLDAATVIFSGSAFIPSASITDLTADKITTGTLNASNVNIINLNVSKLVGDTSLFVKSAWNNSVGGGVNIDGTGIQTVASDGSETYIQNGVFGARNPAKASLGHIGYRYTDGRPFYNIKSSWGTNFSITAAVGSTSNETVMMEIFPGSSEVYVRTNDFRHVGNFARFSGNVQIDGSLSALTSTFTAQQYRFRYGSWLYDNSTNSQLFIVGGGGIRMYTDGASGSSKSALSIDNYYMYMTRHISMEGYNITNQSDRRMKKNIETSTRVAIDGLRKWNFVNYEWIDDDKPKGPQFGLIAQDTPELMVYGEEHSYYSVDSSRQIMLNSKVSQELILRTDEQEIKFIELETKYELLLQKIEKLESGI